MCIALTIGLSTGRSSGAEDSGREEAAGSETLFERIFGRPQSGAPQRASVPLYVEGRHIETVEVGLAVPREDSVLPGAPLLRGLEEWLPEALAGRLAALMDARGNVSFRDARSLGLEVMFDEARLELRVLAPAELRLARETRLGSGMLPPGTGEVVLPSAFSAYVNLRSGFDHVQRSGDGRGEGFRPIRAEAEGAINLRNWVVEGSASYAEGAAAPFRRGDVRLVRDDPGRSLRYSVGDLAYPVAGFQGFRPMAGVTVAKNFSLQPYRVTQPRGRSSFFLQSPSRVEVLVNGRRVQTLQLPAGPHHLTDFLFASGGNEVVLQITDDVGRVEVIQLSFFFDSRLLARGEQEFSYSVGVPSREGLERREYEPGRPMVSLFHRVGVTDTWTSGLNFQGDADRQMGGLEAVWATPLGIFQPDLALSYAGDLGAGWAGRLGYRYHRSDSLWNSVWSFAVQYRDAAFSLPGNSSLHNPVAWDLSARYSQQLPWRMHGGVGGSYQVARGDRADSSGLNLFLSKRLSRSSFADLTLDRRETGNGAVDYRAYATMTFRFGGNRQSLRVSHDTRSGMSRADWRYASPRSVGGLNANLGLQRSEEDYAVFGGAQYRGHRAEAQVSHDVTTPVNGGGVDSRTSFRFGTALVYAGGEFAVTRPVRESFLIVAASEELKPYPLGVNPIRNYYSARSGWLGPAVLPDLSAYQVRAVLIDAPDAPLGYDLGPGRHSVFPSYKSGTVIRLGTGGTVMMTGTLTGADGEMVALAAGEVSSVEGAEAISVEFFTNRRGRFSVEGLRPGRFELRLYGRPGAALRFEIPPGTAGIYDAGILRSEP